MPLHVLVLCLIPGAPLLAAAVLLAGRRMSRRLVGGIATAAVTLSLLAGAWSLPSLTRGGQLRASLWTWLALPELESQIALSLDAPSATVAIVVASVALLVFVYATEHMSDEPDLARFFGQLSLFVGAMLLLVTADDLLLLYLGWEGVGLCSMFLIGFWYREEDNLRAAKKAFVLTRIGDAALALGLILIVRELGTTSIPAVLNARLDGATANWIGALLLTGAVAKSAQLPLSSWLPDAMAGPTPVSALMHAATMVAAGVFLVVRLHPVFLQAPAVLEVAAAIGAVTLLYGALSALAQNDIKRVLAYSTISQLGFMFVAVGVGAFDAALFHLTAHAFFKALLFLVAGVVIRATGKHDLREIGGLRDRLTITHACAVVGGAALAGLPLVTAGAFSKEAILLRAWLAPHGGRWLGAVVWIGTMLTGLYVVRWLWLIFYRPSDGLVLERRPRAAALAPMAVLAAGSILIGYLHAPVLGLDPWSWWLDPAMAAQPHPVSHDAELTTAVAGGLAGLAGLGLATLLHRRHPRATRSPLLSGGSAPVLSAGFGLDAITEGIGAGLARGMVRRDPVDRPFRALATGVGALAQRMADTDRGLLRHYAIGVALGALLLSTLGVLL